METKGMGDVGEEGIMTEGSVQHALDNGDVNAYLCNERESVSERLNNLQVSFAKQMTSLKEKVSVIQSFQSELAEIRRELKDIKSKVDSSVRGRGGTVRQFPSEIFSTVPLSKKERDLRTAGIRNFLGGRNVMVRLAQSISASIMLCASSQVKGFRFLELGIMWDRMEVRERDRENQRDTFGVHGASVLGALLSPLAQCSTEREGPIGKLNSQIHRSTMFRAIGYAIHAGGHEIQWLSLFDSPEVVEIIVNRYFDRREKITTNSSRSTPTKTKKRKTMSSSTVEDVAYNSKMEAATDVMNELMRSTTLKVRNARYQMRMTLHRRLTFMLDLIYSLGGTEAARERGVSIEWEQESVLEDGLLSSAGEPVPSAWDIAEMNVANNTSLRDPCLSAFPEQMQRENAQGLDAAKRRFRSLVVEFRYPRTVQQLLRIPRSSPEGSRSTSRRSISNPTESLQSTHPLDPVPDTVVSGTPTGSQDMTTRFDSSHGNEYWKIRTVPRKVSTMPAVNRTVTVCRRNGTKVRVNPCTFSEEWGPVLNPINPRISSKTVRDNKIVLPFQKCSVIPLILSSEQAPFLWPHEQRISLIDVATFVLSEAVSLTVPIWLASSPYSLKASVLFAFALRGLLRQHTSEEMDELSESALRFVVNGTAVDNPLYTCTGKDSSSYGTKQMKENLFDIFTIPYSEYEQAYELRNSMAPFAMNSDDVENDDDTDRRTRFARFGE